MTRPASPAAGIALLMAFALFMASLGVNTWQLGTRSVIFDEATSVAYARLPPSRLAASIAEDPNQSFYYIVLSAWVYLAGETEAAVRLPSAIAMALSSALVFLVGLRLIGSAAALWAGLIFLSNAFIVRFAQTARGYALLTLLTLLATLLLVDELAWPSPRRRLAYIVVCVLAVQTHYFAALTLAAHFVILMLARASWRTWLPVTLAIGVLLIPAAWMAYAAGAGGLIRWIPAISMAAIRDVLTDFAGGSARLFAVLLALAVLGIVWAAGPARRGAMPVWQAESGVSPHAVLLTLLSVPLALALAASLKQPASISYYLIACVPALCLLAASARPAMGRLAGPIVMTAVVILSLSRLPVYDASQRAENWRDATNHILSARQSDDAVVFLPEGAKKSFDYYVRQAGEQVAAATDTPEGAARVWLLIRDSDRNLEQARLNAVQTALRATHRLVPQPEFRRLTIERWDR